MLRAVDVVERLEHFQFAPINASFRWVAAAGKTMPSLVVHVSGPVSVMIGDDQALLRGAKQDVTPINIIL